MIYLKKLSLLWNPGSGIRFALPKFNSWILLRTISFVRTNNINDNDDDVGKCVSIFGWCCRQIYEWQTIQCTTKMLVCTVSYSTILSHIGNQSKWRCLSQLIKLFDSNLCTYLFLSNRLELIWPGHLCMYHVVCRYTVHIVVDGTNDDTQSTI